MLSSQRHLFDVPRDVAYLTNASYSPLPKTVRAAGEAGVAAKSLPWQIDPHAVLAGAKAVRAAAGRFVGAGPDDIALVPSAAYGIATAAANLPVTPQTRILLMQGEFPSQSLDWARQAQRHGAWLDLVPRPADGAWTEALLARIAQPGLPPVGIAALTPLDWSDGTLIDLTRLCPALHAQGAAIVVDATQAAGVLPVDAAGLGVDYLVFPTYKWLLGPYTLAFLYAAPHRQFGTPLEQHGANRIGGTGPFGGALGPPIPTAHRYDMGQRLNPVGLPMALAGMELLHGWGRDAIAERCRSLTDAAAAIAERHGPSPVPRALRAPHILGMHPPAGHSVAGMGAALAAHDVYVAERGSVMRLGAHVYNDEADLERFDEALRSIGAPPQAPPGDSRPLDP